MLKRTFFFSSDTDHFFLLFFGGFGRFYEQIVDWSGVKLRSPLENLVCLRAQVSLLVFRNFFVLFRFLKVSLFSSFWSVVHLVSRARENNKARNEKNVKLERAGGNRSSFFFSPSHHSL